jgi:hypothetical protein
MTEPTVSTATAGAIAAGAVTVTGSIFGLEYDALIFGLIGSLALVMHLPTATLLRTVGMVMLGALLSAGFSPMAVAAAIENFKWANTMPVLGLRMGCGIGLGLCIPAFIPLALKYSKRKEESLP